MQKDKHLQMIGTRKLQKSVKHLKAVYHKGAKYKASIF